MAGVNVTARLIQVDGGKKELLLALTPFDSGVVIQWQLDAKSARAVATLLVNMADEAGRLIVMPTIDSTPPKPS